MLVDQKVMIFLCIQLDVINFISVQTRLRTKELGLHVSEAAYSLCHLFLIVNVFIAYLYKTPCISCVAAQRVKKKKRKPVISPLWD